MSDESKTAQPTRLSAETKVLFGTLAVPVCVLLAVVADLAGA